MLLDMGLSQGAEKDTNARLTRVPRREDYKETRRLGFRCACAAFLSCLQASCREFDSLSHSAAGPRSSTSIPPRNQSRTPLLIVTSIVRKGPKSRHIAVDMRSKFLGISRLNHAHRDRKYSCVLLFWQPRPPPLCRLAPRSSLRLPPWQRRRRLHSQAWPPGTGRASMGGARQAVKASTATP